MADEKQNSTAGEAESAVEDARDARAPAAELPVEGRRHGLQIVLSPNESREYIFTNKNKAYYAGDTGAMNTRSYHGFIVERHKFLEGWDLLLGNAFVSRWDIKNACVLPQSMTRTYVADQTTESVFLADDINVLILSYGSNFHGRAAFLPRIDIRHIWEEARPEYVWRWDEEFNLLLVRRLDHPQRTAEQDYPVWMAIACDHPCTFEPQDRYLETTYTKSGARRAMASALPYVPGRIEFEFDGDEQFWGSATFAVAVGDTAEEAARLARGGLESEFALYDAKMHRVATLLGGVKAACRDGDYKAAIQWAAASVDALIMNMGGRGIFAGLHWFPNYWGRDTFVSLPGACLVRGEFDVAREILETFARHQYTRKGEKLYGRIPNLIMPESTFYNTADGTWWFVRAGYEYLRYTGDREFAREFLPVVRRAIEGALEMRTDEQHFLTHGDAETWMDAGGEERPYSPRGNRAVDVQALWYAALESGADLADLLGEDELAANWRKVAGELKVAFREAFWDEEVSGLYDHLNRSGTPDAQIRPNQIFAATVPWSPLLSDEEEAHVVRLVRDTCALRHGITTLDPADANFHPRHLDLDRYHFDEAYHNGDVWVWLTGPVVSALIKQGEVGRAWEQTRVLRDLMFDEGAAGTLPELRNGIPPDSGDNVAGAVSQAWSLAEFLRNFYQDYLGVKPNLLRSELNLCPALPRDLSWVKAYVRLGGGRALLFYSINDDGTSGVYTVTADDDLPPLNVRFATRVPLGLDVQPDVVRAEARLSPGGTVVFQVVRDGERWTVTTHD